MNKHREFVKQHRDLYDALLEAQNGRCALCPNQPGSRRLHIDHDHRTMTLRGLLCHRCNRALADWVDGSWLRRAAGYVDRGGVLEHVGEKRTV